MTGVLTRWNALPNPDAVREILPCCGSKAWAGGMAARRPFHDVTSLLAASDETWSNLSAADWMEAFRSHPRIGESKAHESPSLQSAAWSAQEQQSVAAAADAAKSVLAEANKQYERRFGQIFIVCATGKSAAEILEILQRRLQNDEGTEILEAAEQQRQITRIRVTKWLSE
jgi:2-oxo-4-hydroxy-4-carboxy-5-ureidoimidazoline decarboxylase